MSVGIKQRYRFNFQPKKFWVAKHLLTVVFVFSSIFYFRAQAEGMSKDEMDAYMKGGGHALSQA